MIFLVAIIICFIADNSELVDKSHLTDMKCCTL